MGKLWGLIVMAAVIVGVWIIVAQQKRAGIPAGLPEWAYAPPPPPGSPPTATSLPADDNAVIRMPGTDRTMTRGVLRARGEVPDWHPEDRKGEVPSIVKSGRKGVFACSLCHLPDGTGRPENAPVNGLNIVYVNQQMSDFKNGLRRTADPRNTNTNFMISFAQTLTDDEISTASEYFAAQPNRPQRFKVVESRTAPRVRLQGMMYAAIPAAEGGGMKRLRADEIIELPDDNLRVEVRDTRMNWTVYVPIGAIEKGKQLVSQYQCTGCHGPNLEGISVIPPLAGRSPSYTTRQLFDMKAGTRRGPWATLMKGIVRNLSPQDMMALSAYAASLPPQSVAAPSAPIDLLKIMGPYTP